MHWIYRATKFLFAVIVVEIVIFVLLVFGPAFVERTKNSINKHNIDVENRSLALCVSKDPYMTALDVFYTEQTKTTSVMVTYKYPRVELLVPYSNPYALEWATHVYLGIDGGLRNLFHCALEVERWSTLRIVYVALNLTIVMDDSKIHFQGSMLWYMQFHRDSVELLSNSISPLWDLYDLIVSKLVLYDELGFMGYGPPYDGNIENTNGQMPLAFKRYAEYLLAQE